MPGNEPGDRVHNFFAQDLLFRGQQQSQAVEDRGEDGYSSQFKHGANFIQSTLRPHSIKGPNEMQPNMNNFGLPLHGLQQSVPNNFSNTLVPSNTPLSAAGFELFNGQQQGIHQQSSMPQFLQSHMSGPHDSQTLHRQLMTQRMQELQRQQQQVPQFDSRQHPFVFQSPLVDVGTGSETFRYPSSAEDGANWIHQSSPNMMMNGSFDGLHQFDQSLYGAPVPSSTRHLLAANDSYVTPQVSNSYLNDNQHNSLTKRVQVAPSEDEAGLDPEEKMFLFGSDDNLRNAFGAVPRISEEVNIFGDTELSISNSLAGNWSSLMQSAAGETSGNAMPPKEFGLFFEGNNGPVGSEQLLQTSAASLTANGWKTPSALLPGGDGFNIPDPEQLKHSLQFRQDTMMQGGMGSLWKQNPALSYGIESGINDPLAQSNNPARIVNNDSYAPKNSIFNQWRSAQNPVSSQEGKRLEKLQNQAHGPNVVLGSMSSMDGDKTDKEGNKNDVRSPSPVRQNSSKVSAPRKFRYHPMGNADENTVAERIILQQAQARAMPQQNSLLGPSNLCNHIGTNSTVQKKGHPLELQGDANDAKNEPSDKISSHQALQRGFGLHLGPPSQRFQVSQGGKTNSPRQMPENIPSAFISGVPNSKNHLDSQQPTMPRVQTWINSSGQHRLVQSRIQPPQYQNILESSSAPSMESLKNHFENSPADSTSMLEEVKDFGQPDSSPNQTQSLRNADIDAINGGSKIKEGPKSLADDFVAPQDKSVLGSSLSQGHTYSVHASSARVELRKEGQTLQIHGDAHKVNVTAKPGEHTFALTKSTGDLGALNSDEKGSSSPLVASEINRSSPASAFDGHYSPSLPQLNVVGQHPVDLGHKKRKYDTFGVQPWHKEISDSSHYLKTHSTAEADRTESIKRVSRKVDDIAEPKEEASSPVLRAKKRLMTSSRLMQQLIGPLPTNLLSADAVSSYDVAPYSASRIALGDACRAVSTLGKHEPPARNDARGHQTAANELADRVAKIKEKLPSLEKSASSLLDLRTECQEVEKHTALYRLHRFHVRERTDNAAKPSPQRFIKAAPVTERIPEDARCLSL